MRVEPFEGAHDDFPAPQLAVVVRQAQEHGPVGDLSADDLDAGLGQGRAGPFEQGGANGNGGVFRLDLQGRVRLEQVGRRVDGADDHDDQDKEIAHGRGGVGRPLAGLGQAQDVFADQA